MVGQALSSADCGIGAAIEPPFHSFVWRPLLPARDNVGGAFDGEDGPQAIEAPAKQHHVSHKAGYQSRYLGGRRPTMR
jgi:hypothetical protein